MKEVTEGLDGRSPPTSSLPLSSGQCRDPKQSDEDSEIQCNKPPLSPLCEELFCSGRTPLPLAPLAGALVTSCGPQSDVVKRGYLGKQERSHKRYFVLRAGSHTGPGRLEWYKNQEKFTAAHDSTSRAVLFSTNKQGVIYLRCCLGVSRICGSRKSYTVALYAKDQTVVLVMVDQQEQEEWYTAMKTLMEEEQRDEENLDEEDDGYCTLPPAAFFKEVWPVTVKSKGASCSNSLVGENRLCLTPTSLIMVRVGAGSDLPSVTIPLLSVRRFGHLDGSFFLELGRSAPNGPGEIWMEARDQGDHPSLAQHIHEVVREAVRGLRVLPDFSRSPSYNKNPSQVLLVSKRCRPKYRGKTENVRPEGPDPLTNLFQQYPDETRAKASFCDLSPPKVRTVSYLEMNHCRSVAVQNWEPAEEEVEGEEERGEEEESLGYMVMSPQVSHSQEDYVTMTSPQRPFLSTPVVPTSFSSSTLDNDFPLDSSPHQLHDPLLVSSCVQSEMTTGCFSQTQAGMNSEEGPAPSPDLPRETTEESNSSMDAADEGVRRSWLLSCLPSCLQPDGL